MLCWLLTGHGCSCFTELDGLQSLCHADQYAQAIAKLIACDNTRETIKLGRERVSLGRRTTVNLVCVCDCLCERKGKEAGDRKSLLAYCLRTYLK